MTGTSGAYGIPTIIATLPTGYTQDNCYVAGSKIYYDGKWYSYAAQQPVAGGSSVPCPALGNLYMTEDGINATVMIPVLANLPFEILLVKS